MTRPVRPKDAASLVLLDRSDPEEPRLLMGRRHSRHAFMAGVYVFPGGGVDRTDSQLARHLAPAAADLDPKLFAQTPARFSGARARALQLAAIRECFEETGWLIGAGETGWYRGTNPSWASFARLGGPPRLECLQFIARAITPPGRVRRFDARFFLADRVDCLDIPPQPMTDELQELGWYSFAEIASLELAQITRALVGDIHHLLQGPTQAGRALEKPFYFARHNQHIKMLL